MNSVHICLGWRDLKNIRSLIISLINKITEALKTQSGAPRFQSISTNQKQVSTQILEISKRIKRTNVLKSIIKFEMADQNEINGVISMTWQSPNRRQCLSADSNSLR